MLRTHGVTLRNKVHSCEIREDLNVEPPPWTDILATLVRPSVHNVPGKSKFCCLRPQSTKDQVVWLHLILLGPVLIWSQELSEIAVDQAAVSTKVTQANQSSKYLFYFLENELHTTLRSSALKSICNVYALNAERLKQEKGKQTED